MHSWSWFGAALRPWLLALAAFFASGSLTGALRGESPPAIDYNRQIRPILSDNCFRCHGPDAAHRQGGLRFDTPEGPLAAADSGKVAIAPGKPEASELLRRIHSSLPNEQMPPPETNKTLTPAQKQLLRDWIAAGAPVQTHWSFVAPKRGKSPSVAAPAWVREPLDLYLLAKLEQEGLAPSAPASPERLVRRLSLDLTGLPPTLETVDAFLADQRPDAVERLTDRLLASANFGERLAVDWLDAARYADTHGYHIDSGRDMTRWREYVIDAFNRNLPYDRFTVEQLAGDLLPDTGDSEQDFRQKVASGFNRNHMINFEGGAVAKEYHTAYIVDRVNTTATVFLGLTVACSQCHDHKYDPLSQREFYQLFAFFHNVPENGLDGSKGNAQPLLSTPSPREQFEKLRLEQHLASLQAELEKAAASPELLREQAEWETAAKTQSQTAWQTVEKAEPRSMGGATFKRLDDGSWLATGANPATDVYEITFPAGAEPVTAVRVETLADGSFPARGPGRSENGNFVLTQVELAAQKVGGVFSPVPLAKAVADFSQETFPVSGAIDKNQAAGWAIYPQVGKDHWAWFQPAIAIPANSQVRLTLKFQSRFGKHQAGRIRVSLTSADDPGKSESLPAEIRQILLTNSNQRTPSAATQLTRYFAEQVSTLLQARRAEIAALQARRRELDTLAASTMVMQEMPQPRETFVLVRGQYDKPGDRVTAAVPAVLPPLPAGAPANRLGLARWLTSADHPLLSRVTVNRYWQLFFGSGIVSTPEDFGSQGAPPTHPELLDYLAVEFASFDRPATIGWDVKRLVRRLVGSAAYRQDSSVRPEALAKDPENRLLARGPRFRLQAEFLRDQALFHSGLLDRALGGKSVSPYQPAGLWEELMSRADNDKWTAQKYQQDHGQNLYRRTMYTFWKRTCPPAQLATLDAPDRETCVVRRARTNTPLQALVLLNDPTYVEAARMFAERILTAPLAGSPGPQADDARLEFAFRSALARKPAPAEMAALRKLLAAQRARYQAAPAAAEQLLAIGEYPRNPQLPPAEHAAWTMTASALLNLDETLTKN